MSRILNSIKRALKSIFWPQFYVRKGLNSMKKAESIFAEHLRNKFLLTTRFHESLLNGLRRNVTKTELTDKRVKKHYTLYNSLRGEYD